MIQATDIRGSIALLATLFAFLASPLHAQEQSDRHPYLTTKYYVDLGVFFPHREVTIRVDGSTNAGQNTGINTQEEFGLKKSDDTFSLNLGWRFGEKWELQGQFFESSGARQKALEEDVEWKDIVFSQGTSVTAGQDFSLVRLFFARRFESRDHHEFGVGAGLHVLELGAFIEGFVDIVGMGNVYRKESVSTRAPLPNIGFWYMHSFSPQWAFRTRLDWLSADVGDYNGQLINAALGVNYQVFENFGLGLNYNRFDLDLGVKKSGWKGSFNTNYKGLFVNISFFW